MHKQILLHRPMVCLRRSSYRASDTSQKIFCYEGTDSFVDEKTNSAPPVTSSNCSLELQYQTKHGRCRLSMFLSMNTSYMASTVLG